MSDNQEADMYSRGLEKAQKEIQELKAMIKETTPHVKKSLDSIFEIDLRFSHMIKNKEACEKWLEKAEKIK